ncbi:hypothetical protein O181_019314 [Austropuccinia psidii MF-1]|uniref:Tf2-1-like SH3-like domain-containing protein n=1 Tax=Austropuccinia psidii MF-1 TaxID=1389203 RepID=A0A9Q3C9A0_9BASI|nr:hypothetical protein [Austropuccinia psidii MF-1]
MILDMARPHENRCMQDSFKYAKERINQIHKPPKFKLGDWVLVSTLNFDNIKVPKKLEDSFVGTFMIKELHGPNAVQLELTGELMNKHPAFPVSFIRPYSSCEKVFYPLRNKPALEIPLLEGEERKIVKFLNKRRTKNKKVRVYVVWYKSPIQEYKWLLEKDITNSDKLLRRFINKRRPRE